MFWAYVPDPHGGVVWFANPPRAEEPGPGALETMTDGEWRTWLLDRTRGGAGPIADILRAAPGPLRGWATYDVPRLPVWHRDRMVVIGDAAHAASPSSGQGAAMALEDAVMLARLLRDVPHLEEAFTRFEALRRPRVERIVRWGAPSSSSKAAGPVGRVIRDAVMPQILPLAARADMAWIHAHHIDWAQPAVTAQRWRASCRA